MKTLNTLLTLALLAVLIAPLLLASAKFITHSKPGRTPLATMRRAFGLRGGHLTYNTSDPKEKVRMLFAPAVEIALNADTLPEWIQLAPYGEHPTRDKKRIQVFNADSAAQVVTWFDFWPRKIGRLMGINACPIWVGHPDFDSATWPDRRRIGSILELDAREDGLYGKIEWNASAEKALRDEGHKYPSVAWDCDEINAEQITPVMLWSVGMWHRPNIKSVQSVINADAEMDDDTQDPPETKPEEKPTKSGSLMESLMSVLMKAGVVKDGDSEDSVLAAVGNLISSLAYSRQEEARREEETARLRTALNAGADAPADTLLDQALTELNTARETITTLNAARVEDELTRLIETGRCTRADEETVRTELNADFDKARAKYTDRKPQLNSNPLNLGKTKPAVTESHERMAKLQTAVNAHMEKTGCSYDAAWTWSKTAEETKVLHDSMSKEDESRTA